MEALFFTAMSSTNCQCKNVSESKSSTDNLECRNSLPGSSKEDVSEKYFDKTGNNNASENSGSNQLIPADFIESRLRHFFTGEIDKDICQMIAYYCSYKIIEIFKASADYMNRCGRLKFTADDFNKGLFFCDENPILCSTNLPTPVKKKRQRPKSTKKLQSPDFKVQTNQRVYIKEIWLNDISPLSTSVDDLEELQSYLKAVTDVLLNNIEEASCIITNDLQTNENIIQLVPHLINLFCDVMNEYKYDFLKISLLLKFLDAFLRNPYLYFGQDSYLNVLSYALLKFLVANLPTCDQFRDCWTLKDTAANILAFILKKSKYQHLFFEVIYFARSVLLTFKNSLNSHYGALVVVNSIGVPAILLILPSYIHRFHEHTQVILSFSNQSILDVQMVKGQIINSYYLLVDFYLKNEIKKPKFSSEHHFNSIFFLPDYLKDIKIFPILSQSTFSDYFGDALLPAFPLLNFVSHSTYLKETKQNKHQQQNLKKKITKIIL